MTTFEQEFLNAQNETMANRPEEASEFFLRNQAAIEFYNALPETDFTITNGKTSNKIIKARSKAEAEAKLAKNPAYKSWRIITDSDKAEVCSYIKSMVETHDMRA